MFDKSDLLENISDNASKQWQLVLIANEVYYSKLMFLTNMTSTLLYHNAVRVDPDYIMARKSHITDFLGLNCSESSN